METLKKYLPLIIIAIVGIYIVKKFAGSGGTSVRQVIPLTPTTEPSYTDPLLPFRAQAYESLVNAGIAQTQSQTAKDQNALQRYLADVGASVTRGQQVNTANIERGNQENQYNLGIANFATQLQIALQGFDLQRILGLKSGDVELGKADIQSELAKYLQSAQLSQQQFLQNSYIQQLQLYYDQRAQDRQLQQSAIDRYFQQRSGNSTAGIIGSIGQALGGIFGGQGGGSIFTPPTFPSGGFGGFF